MCMVCMYAYQYRSIHRPLIYVSCSLTLFRFTVVLCNCCTSYSTYCALILHCKVFVQRFNNYASDLKLIFQQYCIIGVLWGASIHKTFYALTFKHSKPMIYATWTYKVKWLFLGWDYVVGIISFDSIINTITVHIALTRYVGQSFVCSLILT